MKAYKFRSPLKPIPLKTKIKKKFFLSKKEKRKNISKIAY